ncbi:DUF397 domain-containing protein [Pseudonocardia acaciae]|uniref:DUF397 domain-containing protein n=1 Tax=Pseudonocardia acaciae TaxID=551276 RepID=UPI00048B7995|nr:DUF397 domain-containing protein [Pseudonocardia acaciae]
MPEPTRATWRKSSYSGNTSPNCVEVADRSGFVLVRDSKLGAASPILTVTTAQWHALLTAIQANDLGA